MAIAASMMESEVLKSVTPANVGYKLANFADNSAYAQVRYELTPQFAVGLDPGSLRDPGSAAP